MLIIFLDELLLKSPIALILESLIPMSNSSILLLGKTTLPPCKIISNETPVLIKLSYSPLKYQKNSLFSLYP